MLPVARAQARAGQWALQSLLDRAGAVELVLNDAQREQLRDWDVASDIE